MPEVRERVLHLHAILAELNSSLVAQHIKGTENTVSDLLSRVDVGDSF